MQTAFGQYHLLRRIATGGMGEVYLARLSRGQSFQKIVAVKKILPHISADLGFQAQFENEARFAARLHHAGIVAVYDFGTTEGQSFLAMEYLDGLDLAALLRDKDGRRIALPEAAALSVLSSLLGAVDYLHRLSDPDGKPLSLIHQDLSPHNVLVSVEGEVKLTDFGLVRALHSSREPLAGRLQGKLSYLAPEAFAGAPPSRGTDCFAAGCILYECLMGLQLYHTLPPDCLDARRREGAVRDALAAAEMDRLDPSVREALRLMLEPDPSRRADDAGAVRMMVRRRLAALEAENGPADLAGLAQAHPERRPEASRYLEADRTMVAEAPFATTAPTQDAAPASDSAPPRDTTVPKRTKRRWLSVVGALLALSAAFVLGVQWWRTEAPLGMLRSADTLPAGCTVRVDGQGIRLHGGRLETTLRGRASLQREVTVACRYHELWKQTVDFSSADSVVIEPQPVAQQGSLRIETTPAGAAVLIGAQRVDGVTPATVSGLPLGEPISVQLRLPGHIPFSARYTLEEPEPLLVEHRFETISVPVTVIVEPPDATLWVDGKPTPGRSPFLLTSLLPDRTYRLAAAAEGRNSSELTIEPHRDVENRAHLVLSPLSLTVRVVLPDGYTLRRRQDSAPPPNPLVLRGRGAGQLLAMGDGSRSLLMRLSLAAPAPHRPEPPRLLVNLDARPWAMIEYQHGQARSTPLSDMLLTPGVHRLLARFENKGENIQFELHVTAP